jgi:hypothetical protein
LASHVIADRGWDSSALIEAICAADAKPVILPHLRRRDQQHDDSTANAVLLSAASTGSNMLG